MLKRIGIFILEIGLIAGVVIILAVVFRWISAGIPQLQQTTEVAESPYPPATFHYSTKTLDPNAPYPPSPFTPDPLHSGEVPTETPYPTETEIPVPTLLPTPVVTPIPLAEPPLIPIPDNPIEAKYKLVIREGDVLYQVDSQDGEKRVLLDVNAQTGLYLPYSGKWKWGTASPDGSQIALVLSTQKDPPQKGHPSPVYGIYLFDLPSGKMQLLVQDGVEPVWSPDGTRIAYRD